MTTFPTIFVIISWLALAALDIWKLFWKGFGYTLMLSATRELTAVGFDSPPSVIVQP
jgi:hypothetical protein